MQSKGGTEKSALVRRLSEQKKGLTVVRKECIARDPKREKAGSKLKILKKACEASKEKTASIAIK